MQAHLQNGVGSLGWRVKLLAKTPISCTWIETISATCDLRNHRTHRVFVLPFVGNSPGNYELPHMRCGFHLFFVSKGSNIDSYVYFRNTLWVLKSQWKPSIFAASTWASGSRRWRHAWRDHLCLVLQGSTVCTSAVQHKMQCGHSWCMRNVKFRILEFRKTVVQLKGILPKPSPGLRWPVGNSRQ